MVYGVLNMSFSWGHCQIELLKRLRPLQRLTQTQRSSKLPGETMQGCRLQAASDILRDCGIMEPNICYIYLETGFPLSTLLSDSHIVGIS